MRTSMPSIPDFTDRLWQESHSVALACAARRAVRPGIAIFVALAGCQNTPVDTSAYALVRDSVISQGIELESQRLAFRSDPSVSDQASAVGTGDHGNALLSDLMCVLMLDAERRLRVRRTWGTSFRNRVV